MSRWVCLSVALAVLLLGGPARAMAVAPMCDPDGASVAAPIPVMPLADSGEIRAVQDCDSILQADARHAGRDRAAQDLELKSPDRALARPELLLRRRAARRAVAVAVRWLPPSAHAPSVYRPPRG